MIFFNYLKKLYQSIEGSQGRPLLHLSTNLKGREGATWLSGKNIPRSIIQRL